MGRFRSIMGALAGSESGATAIEYSLLAALIALAISTAVMTLGEAAKTPFEDATVAFEEAEG